MHVVIIGAGISGLSSAWRAQKEGHTVTLIEASSRVGGAIRTERIGGMLFEWGPHSLRSAPETVQLIKELGLESELIFSSPAANNRYLFSAGKLRKPRPLLYPSLYLEWMRRRGTSDDESIASFFRRRLGKRFYENLINPLTLGIFAGDPERLSMASCFPEFFEAERGSGSLTRAFLFQKKKSSIYTLKSGMQKLIERLADSFQGTLLLNEKYLSYAKGVVTTERREIQADRLILAYPALKVKRSSLTVVSVGWRKKISHPPGFGYLVPEKEGEKILGVVFDSSVFPEQNSFKEETRFTVMMRPHSYPEAVAKEALFRHLGITEEPDVLLVTPLPDAIPQYEVGFGVELARFKASLPPEVSFVGWGATGISVNHCIKATC